MATPNQEAIDTFIGITGATPAAAARKLQEHGANLNEAVDAYFNEGDRNTSLNIHETPVLDDEDDFMDVDELDVRRPHRDPLPLLAAARDINPFSYLEDLGRSVFDTSNDMINRAPFLTHPRVVREIPIEVRDDIHPSGHSGHAPIIEDVTETDQAYGQGIRGTVIVDEDDDDDDDDIAAAPTVVTGPRDRFSGGGSLPHTFTPSSPQMDDPNNDIEEQMIRAAIEASKQEVEANHSTHQFGVPNEFNDIGPPQRQSHLEDPEHAHVVSLSLKTAEQEKALREHGGMAEMDDSKTAEEELGRLAVPNGRLEAGSSSTRDDSDDVEEQPLVRHRSRRMSPVSVEPSKEAGPSATSPPSSPGEHDRGSNHDVGTFPSDEWGGMSSQEHDEAVMLEAAMFGGIPEGSGYRIPYAPPYAPHQFRRPESLNPLPVPRPPSPSLTAQRMIREQQDDEYLASLQADREKELKAIEEAEALHEAEKQKEEESRRKAEEEQELERQLAEKEAILPREPASDDINAVTLLVRMPDGSRHGRRFLKTDQLQSLFNFIDIGRRVKPGSYRLVRPYPRRAFSDGESATTLDELGLTSKQEALFLELI